jgi:CHAT domain-containing protein
MTELFIIDESRACRSREYFGHTRIVAIPRDSETRLNADVGVLSACETGSGRLEGEEGIMDLARSFLIAGAKSVVASLWAVDDLSTATLMGFFYEHLAAGLEVREALRQAQLDFIRNYGSKAEPYYWAGFEVIGDGTKKSRSQDQQT